MLRSSARVRTVSSSLGPSVLLGYVSVCRGLLFPVAQVPSRELAWERNLVAKDVASLEGSAWAQPACLLWLILFSWSGNLTWPEAPCRDEH